MTLKVKISVHQITMGQRLQSAREMYAGKNNASQMMHVIAEIIEK